MWLDFSNYTEIISKIELKKFVIISTSKNPKNNSPLLAQERALIPIVVKKKKCSTWRRVCPIDISGFH